MNYLEVLKDLISIDTSVSPDLDPKENYGKTIEYLEPWFKEVGFETQKIEIPKEKADGKEGRINLIAHRRNPGKPRLIFYTHIDVVPAEGWDAFSPKVEDGKIYGRGAADMKGGIAGLLLGLEMIKEKQLKYDTSVMVTTDEETGQASQIRYLSQFLEPVSNAYFFDLDSGFGYVEIASLGAIQMEIEVKGKSVHSALSHLGENAIEKANLLISALLDLKPKVIERKSEIDTSPDTGLEKMESRLNINMIEGGIKENIVPDRCTFKIDRRLIPEENTEEAERELIEKLSLVKGVEWEIKKTFRIPTIPPLKDSVGDELAEIIREVTGRTGKVGVMGSGDFGPVVTNEWGAKHFGLGTIRSDCNPHGQDEFVYQKDIEDLAVIISRFLSAD